MQEGGKAELEPEALVVCAGGGGSSGGFRGAVTPSG